MLEKACPSNTIEPKDYGITPQDIINEINEPKLEDKIAGEEFIPEDKILYIEIVETPSITLGQTVVITPDGLINSKRNEKDGKAYFGTSDEGNDFIFPQLEKGLGKKHFMIDYRLDTNNYFLKDLGDGTGTFIRITDKYTITRNLILSLNNLHFAILVTNLQKTTGCDTVDKEVGNLYYFLI